MTGLPPLRSDVDPALAIAIRAGFVTGLALKGVDPWEGNEPDRDVIAFLHAYVDRDVVRRVLAAGEVNSTWTPRTGGSFCVLCGATVVQGVVLDVRGYILGKTTCSGDFHARNPGAP